MLIDWFTVGAQTLNFLVLVWLMKRFLYQPILDAIDTREKRIAAQLAQAGKVEADALQEKSAFLHKNEEFEQQRAALLATARDAAAAERQRLLDEARQAADALRERNRQGLEDERQRLGDELSRLTREEVLAISRKALADLADASLEERVCAVFAQRLNNLGAAAKAELVQALSTSTEPLILRSAFDLPPPQRATLQHTLSTLFGTEVLLRFDTGPDLICGIELSANGRKIAWSMDNYLACMTERVDELLKGPPIS